VGSSTATAMAMATAGKKRGCELGVGTGETPSAQLGLYPSRGGAKASIQKNRMGTPACRWAQRRRGRRKWHEAGRERIVMSRLQIAEL
jgi:hypothetical protein